MRPAVPGEHRGRRSVGSAGEHKGAAAAAAVAAVRPAAATAVAAAAATAAVLVLLGPTTLAAAAPPAGSALAGESSADEMTTAVSQEIGNALFGNVSPIATGEISRAARTAFIKVSGGVSRAITALPAPGKIAILAGGVARVANVLRGRTAAAGDD